MWAWLGSITGLTIIAREELGELALLKYDPLWQTYDHGGTFVPEERGGKNSGHPQTYLFVGQVKRTLDSQEAHEIGPPPILLFLSDNQHCYTQDNFFP